MTLEDNRSVGEVLKDIVGNLGHIMRAEIRLAKLEVREEVSKIGRGLSFIAAGAMFGIVAFGFLLWAGVYLLAQVVALWAATLIMAAAAGALGGGLIAVGLTHMKRVALPPRTVASLQEDVRWVKAQNS